MMTTPSPQSGIVVRERSLDEITQMYERLGKGIGGDPFSSGARRVGSSVRGGNEVDGTRDDFACCWSGSSPCVLGPRITNAK